MKSFYERSDAGISLDCLSFEQFLKFGFDRTLEDRCWYHSEDFLIGNPSHTTRHLIKFFREPEILSGKYTPRQIEQGLYFVANLLCYIKFTGLFWDTRLPFELREELIFANYELFARFFAHHETEHVCFMWWDVLAYGYYMENGKPADEDGARVQQAMFETLKKILEIDSEACRQSALHGLGHLKHPETEKTINDFLRRNRVSQELKDYAQACIDGTMG